LAWDATTEPDVAGDELRYGESSGNYTSSVRAGKTTTASVSGLVAGRTYDFAVYAYTAGGLKSAPSNEAVHSVAPPINTAPSAIAESSTTAEDTPVLIALADSDREADALSCSVVTGPTNGTLDGTPPNLTYRPAANCNGSDSPTVFQNRLHDEFGHRIAMRHPRNHRHQPTTPDHFHPGTHASSLKIAKADFPAPAKPARILPPCVRGAPG
jgi:hypothetical protein